MAINPSISPNMCKSGSPTGEPLLFVQDITLRYYVLRDEQKSIPHSNNTCVRSPCGIQSFQDGNGRVGRLILFRECQQHNIVPFIIEDNLVLFYYRGLKEWDHEKAFLMDTCLTAQDRFKAYLDYFGICC